jgi:DNA-binding CsgD family transcriptional regulator
LKLTRERQDAASSKTASFLTQEQCLEPRPERGVGQGTFCVGPGGPCLSGLGSTLFYFGAAAMTRPYSTDVSSDVPPLPLHRDHWQAIYLALRLSPKQAQVVELVLRGLCDKQIAQTMGIGEPTVRTYLDRISARTRTHGRMELAMKVLAVSHEVVRASVIKTDDTSITTKK